MPSTVELIFSGLIVYYLFENLRLLSGLRKQSSSPVGNSNQILQKGISLVIPVRNEYSNLPELLVSLEKLKPPKSGFEVILIDDHSEDGSEILLNQMMEKFSWINVLRLKENSGKPMAIETGIRYATYSIIATSDADMDLNPEWLVFLENKFQNQEGLSMICGPTISDPNGFLGAVQETDWMFMMAVASGSLHSGHPFTAIGNNMAFLKADYLTLGGFSKLSFSIAEDFALFQLFLKAGKTVLFPSTPQNIHITKSNKSFKELVLQRKRWILGGRKSPVRSWVMVLTFLCVNFSFLFGWIMNPWITIISAGANFFTGYFLVRQFCRQTGLKFNSSAFFYYELINPLITILIPLLTLFSRTVKWKGRNHREAHSC